MIAHLRGLVTKANPGEITIDVSGVGYRATMPLNAWDALPDGASALVHITTYVREDRLDLFGFIDVRTKQLFESLIELNGVGPRMGLELCAVPRSMLLQAVQGNDASILSSVKGIGRKTAEKLLLELKSLAEKHPHIFEVASGTIGARYDQDAVAALSNLGFQTGDILRALEHLPKELETTEERVTAALRSL